MQIEQGFSSFFAKVLPYLMIFQTFAEPSAHSTLKNRQIWQKYLVKIEEKSYSTFPTSMNQKPD